MPSDGPPSISDECCDHLHRCGADRRHFHECCQHWHGIDPPSISGGATGVTEQAVVSHGLHPWPSARHEPWECGVAEAKAAMLERFGLRQEGDTLWDLERHA